MPKAHDAAKLQLWRERFSKFDSSTETARHFCLRLGVPAAKFYYWRRRVAQEQLGAASGSPARAAENRNPRVSASRSFVPVLVKPSFSSSSEVAVHLPSGVRIHVPAEAERAVATLLDRLLPREVR